MIFNFFDTALFSMYFFLLFLSIFWVIVLFTEKEKEPKEKLQRFPFFTTIVPAYNEEDTIISTLTSLVNLDYPQSQKEIIVVNDGSKDSTKEKIEQFQKEHSQERIILLNQENSGKAKAMNNGLKIAQGEYFACLDADSFTESQALQKMLPYFEEDEEVAAVCPLLKVKKPSTVIEKVQWHEYIINMFYKLLNARLDCIHVTPGPFSVYRTKIIKELGGYDETTITEDLELAIRLQKHNHKIVQTFNTVTETSAHKSWKKLFMQRVRWYKGSIDNSLKYRSLMFDKKYGDFGVLRMPTMFLSGVIAIILMFILLREIIINGYDYFLGLKAVNFDLITLIKNFAFNFNFNFLSLPFLKMMMGFTLLTLSVFIMYHSFKLVKEKITHHGKTFLSLFMYTFIYSVFIGFVWIYIAFLFLAKKKNAWW